MAPSQIKGRGKRRGLLLSPAENAGTNTPPAGLGDADCDGGVRLIDGTADIGAYEGIDVLFSDGFALRTLRWSEAVDD